MPLALVLIAIGLVASGVRGSYKQLGQLIVSDFTGSNNFLNWLVAIGIVGCIGYVPKLETFSRVFIALIVVTIFLRNGSGVFAQFVAAIKGATAGAPNPSPGNPGTSSGTSNTSNPALPFSGLLPGMNNSFFQNGGIIGGFQQNGGNVTNPGTAGSIIDGLGNIAGLGGG